MKKFLVLAYCAIVFISCTKQAQPQQPQPVVVLDPIGAISDTAAISKYWKDSYADTSFRAASDIQSFNFFIDGEYVSEPRSTDASTDARLEFFKDSLVRFVAKPEGYAITLPLALEPEVDYSLAKYGVRIKMKNASMRITYESVKGYSANQDGYKSYTTGWLNRYFSNIPFLNTNRLFNYQTVIKESEVLVPGYVTDVYSILIKDAPAIEYPYYKLAIIRKDGQWAKFGFILFKSSEDMTQQFRDIIYTWTAFNGYGTAKCYLEQQMPTPNPHWNSATKALYEKLQQQNHTLWGAFNSSMVHEDTEGNEYTINLKEITEEKARMEGPQGWDCQFGIMPTYAPIDWYGRKYYFPVGMANTFAGGDGTNGKPILQYTYQYTTNNNNVSTSNKNSNPSPVISVLRGKYDDYFREIARGIKEYGKPMFFRLNNEMNSDWTSYCGLMTLCDPDLFIQSWKHLYNIFEEEGVDNCIWIFNPNNITAPYCYWGEDICYYPGQDYVQILGLTAYESNNGISNSSFKTLYTNLWNKNKKYFEAMPAIISEFACGSGGNTSGELMRNGSSQAKWIKEMFEEFEERPEYVQNIKGAIWFNLNDGEDASISNFFYLDPRLTESLAAFRAGLAATVPSSGN